MIRSIRAFYLATATGCCFFFFWLGSWCLSWIVLPVVRLVNFRRTAGERTRACQDIVGFGFRLFLGSMRWTRTLVFHPSRVCLDLPDGPFLLIANHPTLIDVTAIMAVHPRICCVAKTELFQSFLAGRLLRYCGHIEGGGDGPLDGLTVIPQAIDRLREGRSVLIFPEGTRSPAHGLRRFKPGAFEICRRTKVPLASLLITCEPPTLLKGLAWYALPKRTAHYRISQLPTLDANAVSGNPQGTAGRVQALFRDQLDALRESASASGAESPAFESADRPVALRRGANHARS